MGKDRRRRLYAAAGTNPYAQAPCDCLRRPRVQSLLLLFAGILLHSLTQTLFNWYVGVARCNDPSTRELLYFLEDQSSSSSSSSSSSRPRQNWRTSIVPPMFRDLTRFDAVLDVPAAEVFGRGVAKSTERDFKKMFDTFEMLGIHTEPESSTTTSTTSTSTSTSNDHHHHDHSNHNHDYASAVHQLRFRTNGETQMPGTVFIFMC